MLLIDSLFSEALLMDVPITQHWHGYLLCIKNTTSKVHSVKAATRNPRFVH